MSKKFEIFIIPLFLTLIIIIWTKSIAQIPDKLTIEWIYSQERKQCLLHLSLNVSLAPVKSSRQKRCCLRNL